MAVGPRPQGGRTSGDRGQTQTLEGVVASLLVLTGLVFALQTTAVTPLSASTASQHIENQQQTTAAGVLASADESGALKRAVLYWNESEDRFHDASRGYYVDDPPAAEVEFFDMLDRVFGEHGIAYNVYVVHFGSNDRTRRTRLVYRGEPSDNAVVATRTVALYDGDHLREKNMSVDRANTVNTTSNYFAPKAPATEDGLYNVVRVEVVVWRM